MTTSASLTTELLAAGPYVRTPSPHALLEVAGRDAEDFLQRLCSQDMAALAPGQLAPAAFLDGKGKLVATCLVGRLEPAAPEDAARFVLETQAHQHAGLLALLDRYHFTEQLAFRALRSVCREQVGGRSDDSGGELDGWGLAADGSVITVRCARRGVGFVRVHATEEGALPALDGAPLDEPLAEALRMVAGFVKVSVESEPNTLALEAGLDDHCSTTKGCYTGQEIVARIHTYGHTNRALCLLRLGAGAPIDAPLTLVEPEDELAVGRVMHAVALADRQLRVGVGYLPKDFQAVGTALQLEDGSPVEVIGYGA